MKRASLIAAALLMAGCAAPYSAYDRYDDPYYDRGYYAPPPAPAEEGAETAQAVCSIDSLTTARNEMRTEVERAGVATGYYGYGRDYDSRERARIQSRETVTERPYGPQTETVELIHAFSSDLDAAYRFATSSCQSYQMCMQNQGYTESACMNSADQWRDARREFSSLSARLAEIRLAITEIQDEPHYPYRHPYPSRHPRYRDRCHDGYCDRYREEECDSVLGDVFTTSTCDYRRPRRHYY
ncbi:MAG: hypothetical protein ACFE0P_09510 [Oceanicaulis sp.]